MSTIGNYAETDIRKANPIFSQIRTTIESAFYGNNMVAVNDLTTAYELTKAAPETTVTDLPIIHTDELGLPADAVMLVNNHGRVVGRTAAARRRIGDADVDQAKFAGILRDAIFAGTQQQFYKTSVVVGLDEDFMVEAHLAVPEGYENNLLSYMLNFQTLNQTYQARYQQSKPYQEGDIFIYADPNFHHPDFPDGLALFDAQHNVAAILGMRYFGELKKSTLTLAWATAHRHGYVACHGGEKAFHFNDRPDQVFAMFGLSGSGKSTLTHAKHGGRFKTTVLHDDAFVISRENGSSVALEPAYFDKTNDYPSGTDETKYFMTLMNVGVTLNKAGQKVLVTEDLRNGNGRTIKSRYASANRVDKEEAPINAIFWIMKDDSLPPVVHITDPTLAATFGATLATKRSSAENLVGNVDRNALVIEPFADPFRAYPLAEDYADFKSLFAQRQVDCYILNTGYYNGKKIPKEVTLGILEDIVNQKMTWQDFGPLKHLSYAPLNDFPVDFTDKDYVAMLRTRLQIRLDWITSYTATHQQYPLPAEISAGLTDLIAQLK
ncbi:phosphoenolpyruvate carboxykinase (ATP) [Loigolactobacillus coryniformis]|jgi:phosphoenolpyruvate carboxykinase (ATP)|nr:phosphoenolpyruvate carboxykinase (ATP) [Loigolactobacillus coryniformis]ATO55417.1 phosphoenolpyruvate carboxykinase [Loigolactobacillus coryniformis subsp. coryniformis KCTC 3167 = DSM 20001]MBW4802439.1 phosphoenolpyruvate carboxykinase (ATP) [Loigolactobacillus coryniformis subsp. torquens]MBW4805136.1 phosphoenolpyruvate carboxykinase (ATP) [Loigolactobacillus coryniformis subsp. torquens]OEH89868.1 phosphoenolpyruvate carboxykinase [Loigolactobacillus coryniformis subsp. coryniformis]